MLLCGTEAWTLYRKQVGKLYTLQMRHLRSSIGITWRDHIANNELLKRVNVPSMEQHLMQVNLRWTGHVTHMDSKQLKLSEGIRNKGHHKLRFKDVVN